MSNIVKIGILKAGCLGTLPLLDVLLDERANREDIEVRVVSSGAKLSNEQCKDITSIMINLKPDFVILVGPAQASPGPSLIRRMLKDAKLPTIVISDGPAEKLKDALDKEGIGYIIVLADSMIGAKKEFLDPIEMVLYNSDIIKVMAITGVMNLLVNEIDDTIESIKKKSILLPRIIVDKVKAVEAAEFKNPYAKSKAMAVYEISRHVAEINIEACFRTKEPEKYIKLTAAGHEMMRIASRLADEAREIEKAEDNVFRNPHNKDGSSKKKWKLFEKIEN